MKILIALAAFFLLLTLFHEQWLMAIGDFLIVEDDLHPADVIHIIAGDDYRTDYAIHLYQEGYGKTLYFTGGWWNKYQYFHGEHGQQRSLTAGVPAYAIAIDDTFVKSTYMEAERLKEWVQNRPYPVQSIIVVSDPFHMRRVRWSYKRIFRDNIELQMAPVPIEQTPYQHAWWVDYESHLMVREEYEKFAYYIVRYQLSWGFVRDWLASLDQK